MSILMQILPEKVRW